MVPFRPMGAVQARASSPAPSPSTFQSSLRTPYAVGLGLLALLIAATTGWAVGRLSRSRAHYTVALRVLPRSASIEVDGRLVGTGAWSERLARDGAAHTVRMSAPGYIDHVVRFCDASPPAVITLRR